jgi:hypothetical protein
MRFASAIVLALALACITVPSRAVADEPGTNELRAGMCDGFDGLSFVFCVALCEARECDRQDPADERCMILARAFATASNGMAPPCAAPRGTI